MPDNFENLENLVRLAREPSPDKRQELLRVITDLFLEKPAALSEQETDYFADIMGKIAFDLEMEVRHELAVRLASEDKAPRKLINMLANDQIEVARPVLKESGVLQNSDLIGIIKRHSQEHLMAISVRKTLSEEVTEHLVLHGGNPVLQSLAANEGAKLSRKSLEIMTERSESFEPLQEPLIKREDMPADLKHEMFIFVSAALRAHILATVEDVDADEIDRLLDHARVKLDVPQDQQALSPAERFILRKERLRQLNPELLMQLLRQGKIAEFIAGLGRLAEIDMALAHRIVFDKGGEMLAVVCKAIGVDRITFSDLLLLTNQDGARDQMARDALIGVYTRITAESAQKVLRFWRARKRMARSMEKSPEKEHAAAGS